jgi:hypothetical protein
MAVSLESCVFSAFAKTTNTQELELADEKRRIKHTVSVNPKVSVSSITATVLASYHLLWPHIASHVCLGQLD